MTEPRATRKLPETRSTAPERTAPQADLRILHVSPSFYPAVAFGGPIFSTKAITDGMAATPGVAVEVLTTDTADPNSAARLDLPQNPLTLPPGYPVRYCARIAGGSISPELAWRLWAAIRRADVVHLTGPYNFPVFPTLIVCRLTGTPLVWSPRGGFQATAEWSESPKRRVKKAFERVAAALAPRDLVLHVTAPVEAETSRRTFPDAERAIIPNAIEMPGAVPARVWRPEGRLRLAFLSRVHPKKGLDILLPALAELPDRVTLDIYGDGDADYLASLRARVAALKLDRRVTFHGHMDGDAKSRALTQCDLFVLPTHSENFGIVVAEALAHGTPVVTTVNAPWERLEPEGCGLCVAATAEALGAAIRRMEAADLAAWGKRGSDWMQRDFSVAGMVGRFDALYRRLAAGHARR